MGFAAPGRYPILAVVARLPIGDWREAIVQQERELQSRFPGPGSELTVSAEAIGADIGG